MSDYAKLKKLDEESLQQLREGSGPIDECICSILAPSDEKKSFAASVKKVFATIGSGKKRKRETTLDVPLNKDGGGIQSTKEVVKRTKTCGKCGCDSEKFILKHSYANIRITTPDISSICPCPTDCMPDKDKLQNNIKVIVEHAQIHPHPTSSDTSEDLAVQNIP